MFAWLSTVFHGCVAHKENGVHAQDMGREEKNRTGTWKNDVTVPGKQNKQPPPQKTLVNIIEFQYVCLPKKLVPKL